LAEANANHEKYISESENCYKKIITALEKEKTDLSIELSATQERLNAVMDDSNNLNGQISAFNSRIVDAEKEKNTLLRIEAALKCSVDELHEKVFNFFLCDIL
jgi:chromosome segregation ATPase